MPPFTGPLKVQRGVAAVFALPGGEASILVRSVYDELDCKLEHDADAQDGGDGCGELHPPGCTTVAPFQ